MHHYSGEEDYFERDYELNIKKITERASGKRLSLRDETKSKFKNFFRGIQAWLNPEVKIKDLRV